MAPRVESGRPIIETKKKKKRCLQCGVAGYWSLVLKQSTVDIMDGGQGRGDGGRWLHHRGLFDVYSWHQRRWTKAGEQWPWKYEQIKLYMYVCGALIQRQRGSDKDKDKEALYLMEARLNVIFIFRFDLFITFQINSLILWSMKCQEFSEKCSSQVSQKAQETSLNCSGIQFPFR